VDPYDSRADDQALVIAVLSRIRSLFVILGTAFAAAIAGGASYRTF
jgi:hypothetical protein